MATEILIFKKCMGPHGQALPAGPRHGSNEGHAHACSCQAPCGYASGRSAAEDHDVMCQHQSRPAHRWAIALALADSTKAITSANPLRFRPVESYSLRARV